MINKFLSRQAWGLRHYEIASLVLMLIFLPSFEAPKNLFLLIYLLLSLTRQIKTSQFIKFEKIDFIFLFFFIAAFLSTIFAGLHGHEWKGFKSFFTVFIFGWVFARSQYSKATIKGLFLCSFITLLPPLLLGLYELIWTKEALFLKIHSVGYVNASGLYLMTIASATLSYLLFFKPKKSQNYFYLIYAFLIALFSFSLLVAASRSSFLAFLVSIVSSFLLNAPVFEKHIHDMKDNNTLAYRDKLWNVSFEAIRLFSNKFGTGIDNYGFVDEALVKHAVESRGESYIPKNYFYVNLTHNVYLSFLVERGFLGFLSLITLMFFWSKRLFLGIKKIGQDPTHDYLWGASLSAFLSVYLVGFVHVTLVHEPGILALLFFGFYEMYTKFYLNKKA
jgi:hypothetical protein